MKNTRELPWSRCLPNITFDEPPNDIPVHDWFPDLVNSPETYLTGLIYALQTRWSETEAYVPVFCPEYSRAVPVWQAVNQMITKLQNGDLAVVVSLSTKFNDETSFFIMSQNPSDIRAVHPDTVRSPVIVFNPYSLEDQTLDDFIRTTNVDVLNFATQLLAAANYFQTGGQQGWPFAKPEQTIGVLHMEDTVQILPVGIPLPENFAPATPAMRSRRRGALPTDLPDLV